MTEAEEKAEFARAMISTGGNPLESGQLVYPANFNMAAHAAHRLHSDPEVLQLIAEFKKAKQEESGISDEEAYAEEMLRDIIENSIDREIKLKAIGLFMELKGISKKPQTSNNLNVIVPRAIEVPYFQEVSEWEKGLASNQKTLKDESTSRH